MKWVLVARLGLEGVDCLWHAIHTIPEGFLTTHGKFVSDMVNKISKVPLLQDECRELLLLVTNYTPIHYLKDGLHFTAYEKEMWELTKEMV